MIIWVGVYNVWAASSAILLTCEEKVTNAIANSKQKKKQILNNALLKLMSNHIWNLN